MVVHQQTTLGNLLGRNRFLAVVDRLLRDARCPHLAIPAAHPYLRNAIVSPRLERLTPPTGGMATVYLAEDLKHHRKVTLNGRTVRLQWLRTRSRMWRDRRHRVC